MTKKLNYERENIKGKIINQGFERLDLPKIGSKKDIYKQKLLEKDIDRDKFDILINCPICKCKVKYSTLQKHLKKNCKINKINSTSHKTVRKNKNANRQSNISDNYNKIIRNKTQFRRSYTSILNSISSTINNYGENGVSHQELLDELPKNIAGLAEKNRKIVFKIMIDNLKNLEKIYIRSVNNKRYYFINKN